jgi:Helix-turn-helix domain
MQMPRTKSEARVTQKQLDGYVSNKEAGLILNVTRVRVQQLANEGKLPFLSTAIGRLFPRAELEAIAAQRKTLAAGSGKGGDLAA